MWLGKAKGFHLFLILSWVYIFAFTIFTDKWWAVCGSGVILAVLLTATWGEVKLREHNAKKNS